MMSKLKLFLKGIVVGIANIIPGVSGGTMAVILNVYSTLVDFLSLKISVIKKKWKDVLFLALGMGGGILALSWVMDYLLGNYSLHCNWFFTGVVLGSIPMLYKLATKKREGEKTSLKATSLISFAVMLAVMIVIYFASGSVSKEGGSIMTPSVTTYLYMILSGAIAAFSMIVPGISGSFMMLVLGAYHTIIAALKIGSESFNILIILSFAVGAVIGLVGGARLIGYLLRRFTQQTYFGILGLIVGSIPFLILAEDVKHPINGIVVLIIPFLLLICGGVITYLFGKHDPDVK